MSTWPMVPWRIIFLVSPEVFSASSSSSSSSFSLIYIGNGLCSRVMVEIRFYFSRFIAKQEASRLAHPDENC